MIIALVILTAIAALSAYRVPTMYMKPGALRSGLQILAVLLAVVLGSQVASFGPPIKGPLTFSQMVFAAILVLGIGMRLFLQKSQKK